MPEDIKKMNKKELGACAARVREFMLKKVAKTGGHLASSLGVVELTLALHKVFDVPEDKIVWDVGHQTYAHKIITGRGDMFDTLRQKGGLSGFPKTEESEYDCFNTGHSSTSIAAAYGMAKAMELLGDAHKAIAVIGDGALTGGLAFEALNNAGHSGGNILVILNDNEMSINENVGAFAKYLNRMRSNRQYRNFKIGIERGLKRIPKIGEKLADMALRVKDTARSLVFPKTFFEQWGFSYFGIVDGHDIGELVSVLRRVKDLHEPVVLHISTVKGKGYEFAEKSPTKFHGISSFDIKSGECVDAAKNGEEVVPGDVFGCALKSLAADDDKIIAITAAMPKGTGLLPFAREYPKRFFDVGIAEGYAVTFASGLAICGFKPVVAIYSSFLQRAYDQIIHDVVLQQLPVIFAIDRAGLVGDDGVTHNGVFDISYMCNLPGMTMFAPSSGEQLSDMLTWAARNVSAPIAIRYPKRLPAISTKFKFGKANVVQKGDCATIVSVGECLSLAYELAEKVSASASAEEKAEMRDKAEIIDLGTILPLDIATIKKSWQKTGKIIVLEDGEVTYGVGGLIRKLLPGAEVISYGVENPLDAEWSIREEIEKKINNEQ
ncbi:MAG: 1-deoxy-D-xylulose-5-phosphate synthase [Clostridiales bacterium]|nr:1-deoxy-D-xylulose-5-phosphate synthase [Clostridiales bacterium]